MQFIILLWITLVAGINEQLYCSVRYKRLCQTKGRHIACQFPDPGPSESCLNYTAIKFDYDLKNFILYYVNRRRQRIAAGNERVRGGANLPKPEVMMLVEWDRELAFLAQRLADQCHFVHDSCRATLRYPYAGQSVGEVRWRRTDQPVQRDAKRAIRRVLDAWWGERRRVTPNQLTEPFRLVFRGAVWGHFSQLCVWRLRAMGCAAVHHGSSRPRVLLVCDFSHTNMLGQRTLNPGSLTKCPIHTMRRPRTQYPLLCAQVHQTPNSAEQEEDTYDDYEEDFDSGLTADVVDVPTSSTHCTISTRRREMTRSVTYSTKSSFLMLRDYPKTKGLIIEKLDQELERRTQVEYMTSTVTEDQVMAEWRSRRPLLEERLERNKPAGFYTTMLSADYDIIDSGHHEDYQKVIPLQHRTTSRYRPPTTTGSGSAENYLRQRWKQPQDRPIRPGITALLITHPVKYAKQRTAPSLKLDKDDMDQLFRDTGFKLSWKKD